MGRRKDSIKAMARQGHEVSQALELWGSWSNSLNPKFYRTVTRSKIQVGDTYGQLNVVTRVSNSNRGQARYACTCNCGTLVDYEAYQLTSGRTRSCGCLQRKAVSKGE
jgi:hypothetical protein